MITAERYHDFSAGHRVAGHESKCALLHGHNYRVHFICEANDKGLDDLGRVIDFGVMKERLCMWVEHEWDHKFLAWEHDPMLLLLHQVACNFDGAERDSLDVMQQSIVWTSFNPTAENMADYLLNVVGPAQLAGTGVRAIKVVVEETRKCSASASL